MKTLTLFTLFIFATSCFANQSPRVLMMVSEGFYAPEYFKPFKAFQKKGYQITTATKYMRETRPDERQLATHPAVSPDITFAEIKVEDYDAIVFAGGNGAWEDFFPNETVHHVLSGFFEKDKVIALLCSSTGLLGVANNLNGKGAPLARGRNVTGYKRVEALLVNLGKVNYSAGEPDKPYVVVDKNLITGRDPKSSEAFAQAVIKVIESIK